MSYPSPGEIEVEEQMASWLMADAPGAFEIVTDKPAAKALQAPAVDKMIGKAPRSK